MKKFTINILECAEVAVIIDETEQELVTQIPIPKEISKELIGGVKDFIISANPKCEINVEYIK